MKKLKYIGKLQRKVLYSLLEKPSTRVGIIEMTGLHRNKVDVALKSLVFKELVCRDGVNFKINDSNESATKPTATTDPVCDAPVDRPKFLWDIPEGQGNLQPSVGDQGKERTDHVSAN